MDILLLSSRCANNYYLIQIDTNLLKSDNVVVLNNDRLKFVNLSINLVFYCILLFSIAKLYYAWSLNVSKSVIYIFLSFYLIWYKQPMVFFSL